MGVDIFYFLELALFSDREIDLVFGFVVFGLRLGLEELYIIYALACSLMNRLIALTLLDPSGGGFHIHALLLGS